MKNTKLFAVALTAALLSSAAVYAADLNAEVPAHQVQVVSGGVGDAEIDAFNSAQHNYTVKVTYAENTGAYLSDVNLQVRDRSNNTLVNTATNGPIVLMNLKPGSYTLVSTSGSETKTQKIAVKQSGTSNYVVHFRSTDS